MIPNQTKIIAPYIGEKVKVTNERYIDGAYIGTILGVCSVRGLLVEHACGSDADEQFNDCKLILKPLSAITDEHAIELTKIGYGAEHSDLDVDYMKSVCESFTTENPYKFTWDEYQYLQSKGYDLPQYLLDGKTLQQAGLAIYE